MFRKTIQFDPTSFLEVATRVTGDGDRCMLALRGPKNDRESSVASITLTKDEVTTLITHLQDWLKTPSTQLPSVTTTASIPAV